MLRSICSKLCCWQQKPFTEAVQQHNDALHQQPLMHPSSPSATDSDLQGAIEGTTPPAVQARDPAESAQLPLKRQVFISHTGQDEGARVFAASILKPALEAAGLAVYMDFSDLQPGSEWPVELVNAAANSQVFVAVLSKSYTRRYWCMLELDLALNSHTQHSTRPLVIPVFYDSCRDVVTPDAVRQDWACSTGPAWFKRTPEERAWVDAERWADNISAAQELLQNLRRRTVNPPKDEEKGLADEVVKAAVAAIPKQVHPGQFVVGLEQQVAHVKQQMEGKLGVWVYGQGGLGKSTLAQALFNSLSPNFPRSAFVALNESSSMQDCLAFALRSIGAKVRDGASQAELLSLLQNFVMDKAVLLILDNVSTATQLDALLPEEWGSSSCIIATSRQREIPESVAWKRVQPQLYHHKAALLDGESAAQLFRHFSKQQVPTALQGLEQSLIGACKGLPLALKLTGAFLRGEAKPEEWEAALQALQSGDDVLDNTERDLEGLLAAFFGKLTFAQQMMLLDAAIIFNGYPLDDLLALWKVWHGPKAGIHFKGLLRLCLVDVNQRQQVEVHNVLVFLARNIITEHTGSPHCGSRLWVEGGRLQGMKGNSEMVLAACLAGLDLTDTTIPTLYHLSSARVLILPESMRADDFLTQQSRHLLWLECRNRQMGTWMSCTPRLAVLVACHSTSEYLPLLGGLTGLLSMNLYDCWRLKALPESIGLLTALQSLNLRNCRQLVGLPEPLGSLNKLQTLNISRCKNLKVLPESVGQLTALTHLDMRNCRQLMALPQALGQLAALRSLEVSGCKRITVLPASFAELTALQSLGMSHCGQLAELPGSLGQLTKLEHLDLSDCRCLAALPESFGQLKALHHLDLSDCLQVEALPGSFGQLAALRSLCLRRCKQLAALPEWFGQLSALQRLDISGCEKLAALPGSFGQLKALSSLSMCGCKLATLPESFGQLPALQRLDIRGCEQLAALPESFWQLSALHSLNITGCRHLEAMAEAFQQLPALQRLDMYSCEQLQQ